MATEDFQVIKQRRCIEDEKENVCKFVQLKNEMKVMLIHEEDSPETSVALDVHIGNFSNPDDFPGLAHLCQRMITLNSTKYPEFHKFLYNHEGKELLTTSSDHSTYYFRINTENDSVVKEALDRFVKFFLYEPLLDCSWIEKEIQLMDLKLKKELQHDTAWFPYFERSMIETTHPYSKYGLCKKKILKELTVKMIQSRLLSFFTEHYSANVMTLCIISGCNPHRIEKMLAGTFCKIKNREIKIPESYEDPFKNQLCTKWHITPKRNIKNLKLIFPLPDTEEIFWLLAPIDFISYCLESNHKNSLLEVLKAKGWCDSISTIGYQEAKNLNYFHVIFTLLPDAHLYVDDIITIFFKYLELFKNRYLTSPNGLLELQVILENLSANKCFEETRDEEYNLQRIIRMVKHLHEYPKHTTKDIICNTSTFYYTMKLINVILDEYISPETIRVYLITDEISYFSKGMNPKKWNNGGQSYKKWTISETIIHAWKDPFYAKLISLNLNSHLEFWPSRNNLLFYQELPKVIKDSTMVKLWYIPTIRKSNKIKPLYKMIFYFISPQVYENPLSYNLNIMFAELIKRAIITTEYFDKDFTSVKVSKCGILLERTSYVPVKSRGFLSRIISEALNLSVLPEEFEYCKGEYDDKLTFLKRSRRQAYFYSTTLLSEISWTLEEVLEASAYVTIDETQKFMKKFLDNMYIKGLIYGDISIEEALQVTHDLKLLGWAESNPDFFMKHRVGLNYNDVAIYENIMSTISLKRTQLGPFREIKLKDDTHVLFEIENEFQNISCIQVYYQIGKDTMDLNSKLALVHYIMSKKLVYLQKLKGNFEVKIRKEGGTRGLIFIVETHMNPYAVQYYIQKFIAYLLNYICQLSKEDFKKYKTQLITKIPKLKDISDALWREVFTELYFFDGPGTEKEYIEGIKQEELVTFYKQFVCEKRALLSVHVLPKHKNESEKQTSSTSTASEVDLEQTSSTSITSSEVDLESFEINSLEESSSDHVSKEHFKKIDNILLFKQSQDFYD